MLNRDYVNGLIHADDAFTFLRCNRSSPAFWEMKKKELLAMFRQLGCPTIFLTLSAAETKWPELIVILTRVLENKHLVPFEGNRLEDKYIRVEFQFRGSSHIHVFIWLNNAPKYHKNNPKSIEQ
ncbi:unnamed protein product, partial [Rotaria magnacalcarata]